MHRTDTHRTGALSRLDVIERKPQNTCCMSTFNILRQNKSCRQPVCFSQLPTSMRTIFSLRSTCFKRRQNCSNANDLGRMMPHWSATRSLNMVCAMNPSNTGPPVLKKRSKIRKRNRVNRHENLELDRKPQSNRWNIPNQISFFMRRSSSFVCVLPLQI
jgi:hypothetical protein